ncbi:hypothetical protein [Flavobacterium sp.]
MLAFAITFLIALVLNICLDLWIKHRLPSIINEKNNSSYFITYKNLKVSLLKRSILADNLVIVPKASLNDTLIKEGIYAKIKTIEIQQVNVWSLIFSNKIKANTIAITTPKIIIYDKENKHSVRNSVVEPFEKIIKVSNVVLIHGDLKLISKGKDVPILSVQNINFYIKGVLITDTILTKKIPLEYQNYSLSCDSLFYHPNSFYNLKTKKVAITNSNIEIADFEMLPIFPRKEFVANLKSEEDIFTLLCKSISFKNSNCGFKNDDFFFHCKSITLDQANANIYRSKEPADDVTKKNLYNKLLRDLGFDLQIDTLKIKNSKLVYEEEKSFKVGGSRLSFYNFNLNAININSGFKKDKLPDVNIAIYCKFMNNSPFKVNWSFNVLDKRDGFNIQGKLTNFDTNQMDAFTKPYMNVTTKGILNEVHFSFTGNDVKSTGNFALKYDNLEVTVFQKDSRKKKNKFLSFITNLFVKKDSDEKKKDVTVEVERNQQKSFYNFLWLNVAEGLKKVLI